MVPTACPPAIRTRPSASAVAVCRERAVLIAGAADQLPVPGVKISALERAPPGFAPPVTSTRPSASRVAVCCARCVPMGATRAQVPVAGLNTSALARIPLPLELFPPATSTCPSASSTAVCWARGACMGATAAHVPVPGVKISALANAPLALLPPATSTRPSGSSVAVWWPRATVIVPARDQVSAARAPLPSPRASRSVTATARRTPSSLCASRPVCREREVRLVCSVGWLIGTRLKIE